jgi:hypothetical protein
MSEPRFKHDCKQCNFIGRLDDRDLYTCSQGGHLYTLVARYGDDGPDYTSGPIEMFHKTAEYLKLRANINRK